MKWLSAYKFVIVSGFGLLIDIGLAIVLHQVVHLPLWTAALFSFFAVGALNYVLFEFWVFPRSGQSLSVRRLALVLLASTCAAAVRAGSILILEPIAANLSLPDTLGDAGVLGSAAALSFLINFILNKWIFGDHSMRVKAGGV